MQGPAEGQWVAADRAIRSSLIRIDCIWPHMLRVAGKVLEVVVRRVAHYRMWGASNLPTDDKDPQARGSVANSQEIRR